MCSAVIAIAAAGLAALSLTGCTPSASDGDVSRAVTVTEGFGLEPEVSFTAPLAAEGLQRTVITAGDGPEITDESVISVKAKVADGSSGDAISAPGSWPRAFTLTAADAEPGVSQTVPGLRSGSRLVVTGSAEHFYGADRLDAVRLQADQPLVAVLDVAALPTADRDTQPTLSDDAFPQVVMSDGRPTQVAPGDGSPPATTQVRVLKQGTGTPVGDNDEVTFRALTATWGDGAVIGDDFDGDASSRRLGNLPEGLRTALAGQPAGTTLIAVVPPGEGIADQLTQALQHETLVFVITIDAISLSTN